MRKEFVVRYLRRVAVLGPLFALFTFLPPGELSAKIAGVGAFLAALLVAQLLELLVVARNANRTAKIVAARGPIVVKRGSRRHYRAVIQGEHIEPVAGPDISHR